MVWGFQVSIPLPQEYFFPWRSMLTLMAFPRARISISCFTTVTLVTKKWWLSKIFVLSYILHVHIWVEFKCFLISKLLYNSKMLIIGNIQLEFRSHNSIFLLFFSQLQHFPSLWRMNWGNISKLRYSSARVAITKCLRLGGLNNRN